MNTMCNEAFAANRRRLFELMPENSAVFIQSKRPKIRSGDTTYPYSPDRNLYYLTGYENRQAALLMKKEGSKLSTEMFVIELTPLQVHWFGDLPRPEQVKEMTGIETVKAISDLPNVLTRTLGDVDTLFLDFDPTPTAEPLSEIHQLAGKLRLSSPHIRIQRLHPLIACLRELKDDWEIKQIAEAVNLTHSGISRMLKHLEPGIKEYQLEAWFNLDLHLNRSTPSFPTIVAGGNNATILHYNALNDSVADGDLVLFDLGAEYKHYSADISRTFPVNGKFTPEQRELYELVVESNEAAIDAVATGVTIPHLNSVASDVIARGLMKLGYMVKPEDVRKYLTHSITHPLGLDTHDIHGKCYTTLKPGMVITIEPGIYIPEKKLGIRVEDDVAVTVHGCVNLSKDIPKRADEVEAWIKSAKS